MKKQNIIKKLFANFYDSKKVLYIVKQDLVDRRRYVSYLGDVRGKREQNVKLINRDMLRDNFNFFSNKQRETIKDYFDNV